MDISRIKIFLVLPFRIQRKNLAKRRLFEIALSYGAEMEGHEYYDSPRTRRPALTQSSRI